MADGGRGAGRGWAGLPGGFVVSGFHNLTALTAVVIVAAAGTVARRRQWPSAIPPAAFLLGIAAIGLAIWLLSRPAYITP